MMTVTFDEAVNQMRKAGLDVEPYRRGPDGAGVFSAAIRENKIRLFPGRAVFEVATDRKRRQAVLKVVEGTRKVTHKWSVTVGLSGRQTAADRLLDTMTDEERYQVQRAAEANFPLHIPNSRFSGFRILSVNSYGESDIYTGRYWFEVELTRTARKSTNHFLVGQDETNHFISLLPEPANSVDDAHKVLRPKGLRSNSVRQGEWFFEPVSAHRAVELDEAFFDLRSKATTKVVSTSHWRTAIQAPPGSAPVPLESGSSHEALVLTHESQKYARGWVRDTRKGHHEPLWLRGWHKVVRNRERVVMPTLSMQNARFD